MGCTSLRRSSRLALLKRKPWKLSAAYCRAFLKQHKIERFIAWYYTPMALKFTLDFQPVLAIYDCMDELSAFQGAPPELVALERALFRRVAAVFVGGQSLYHVKRNQHNNVHLFSQQHRPSPLRLCARPDPRTHR